MYSSFSIIRVCFFSQVTEYNVQDAAENIPHRTLVRQNFALATFPWSLLKPTDVHNFHERYTCMQGTEAVRWLPAVSIYCILLQTSICYKTCSMSYNKNKKLSKAHGRQAITLPYSKVKHHHKLVSPRPSPFSCKTAHLLPVNQHLPTSPGVFRCFHTPL